MSEEFLVKLFKKLKPVDFKKDKFLQAFHKFYKKEKSDNLFECYMEYITRNSDFKEEERELGLRKIHDDIKRAILAPVKKDNVTTTYESAYTTNTQTSTTDTQSASTSKKITKGPISKTKALDCLSDFIKQSFIITYEDPDKEFDEKDEAFMESTTTNIIDEIHSDGRVLPEPKKDVVFEQRSDMLNIWQNTRQRCQIMMENEQLLKLISKVFYIDCSKLTVSDVATESVIISKPIQTEKKGLFVTPDDVPQQVTQKSSKATNYANVKPLVQQSIETVLLMTDNGKETILPIETFVACYTGTVYNTSVTLSNNYPLQEVMARSKQKLKSIYICSGSQNICGGNADQGIDVAESMLYMTSSYSISLEKTLHAFPLKTGEIVLCPNVLVFKDTNYKLLDTNQMQKIAVMNMPCKYRPKTNLKDPPQNDCEMDERLYDPKTEMSIVDYNRIKTNLIGSIETSLFFGYDTIIIDDLSISDNWLPAYQIAKILREVTMMFKGRVREFVVCANRAKSFNVLKLYL